MCLIYVISDLFLRYFLLKLHSFLNLNYFYDTFQSGFRKLHSTESALLKVTNDIMLATDNGSYALVLLDLSSAFDMVDHTNLIHPTRKSCMHSGHSSKLVPVFFNQQEVLCMHRKTYLLSSTSLLWCSTGFYSCSNIILFILAAIGFHLFQMWSIISLIH